MQFLAKFWYGKKKNQNERSELIYRATGLHSTFPYQHELFFQMTDSRTLDSLLFNIRAAEIEALSFQRIAMSPQFIYVKKLWPFPMNCKVMRMFKNEKFLSWL